MYLPCLFTGLKKRNYYLSLTNLTTKDISGILFGVSLFLNMLFLPFSCFSTWKCINDTYLIPGYTLNTPSAPYFFLYKTAKRNIFISCCFLALKHQSYFFYYSKTSEYVKRYHVCCLFPSDYVISSVFGSLTWKYISGTYLVAFSFVLSF